MFKLLLGLLGLVEVLYPERFMRILTKLSYEYEGEPPVAKPWVVTAARIEGLVVLGVVVYSAIKADCNCSLLCRFGDSDSTASPSESAVPNADSIDRID